MTVRLTAVVLAFAGLTSCSGADQVRPPEPTSAVPNVQNLPESEPPTVPVTTIPAVTGMSLPRARETLSALGLKADAFWVRSAVCGDTRIVVRQRPRASTQLERGQTVRLSTDAINCGEARRHTEVSPELTAVADGFAAFARGERAAPPDIAAVSLYWGGTPSGQVSASKASSRRTWRGCPNTGVYDASCPLDFLGSLLAAQVNQFGLAYTPTAPPGVCLVGDENSAPGTAVPGFEVFFITIDRRDASCAMDFRYEIYVDGTGTIRAVNLLLSEP